MKIKNKYLFYFLWAALFIALYLVSSLLPESLKSVFTISLFFALLLILGISWLVGYFNKWCAREIIHRAKKSLFLLLGGILVLLIAFYEIINHWVSNPEWRGFLKTFLAGLLMIANVGVVAVVIHSFFRRNGSNPPEK